MKLDLDDDNVTCLTIPRQLLINYFEWGDLPGELVDTLDRLQAKSNPQILVLTIEP